MTTTSDFDQIQNKLVDMWQMIGSGLDDDPEEKHTVVVVPSLTVDIEFSVSALQAYEERMLFMLFLLRKPGIRLIYITSQPIHSAITDYYLELIPGIISSHARKRLHLVSPEDGSPTPLSEKLLARPHLIRQIQELIPDMNNAHMVPFNTTDMERELTLKLKIPMYAADPRFFGFGTKSGCRQIFNDENIRHPLGVEDLYSLDAVVDAIAQIQAQRPAVKQVVVKLNEGVSGLGNLLLELTANTSENIRQQIESAEIDDDESYADKIISEGAIVEEFISGAQIESPSVQLRLTPLGQVELLSTHDQMLGGPSGQSYLGAVFPADTEYSAGIIQDAIKIGERLAKEGILGRFAVDFVVVKKDDGTWENYAIEINLRKGGTTAPFLILQYLTDGHYDPASGVFLTGKNQPRYYVASDHVEAENFRLFTTDHLFDIVSTHQLHFNHATQTGVVMHLISDIGELGRVGITAIGESPAHARQLFQEFIEVMHQEAEALLRG